MYYKFTKSDLLYVYRWKTKRDDPDLRGEPDRSLFNRHQGYDVLYLINKFLEAFDKDTSVGYAVEKELRQLPSNIRQQDRVLQWLKERMIKDIFSNNL
jgi:hypothetical protein